MSTCVWSLSLPCSLPRDLTVVLLKEAAETKTTVSDTVLSHHVHSSSMPLFSALSSPCTTRSRRRRREAFRTRPPSPGGGPSSGRCRKNILTYQVVANGHKNIERVSWGGACRSVCLSIDEPRNCSWTVRARLVRGDRPLWRRLSAVQTNIHTYSTYMRLRGRSIPSSWVRRTPFQKHENNQDRQTDRERERAKLIWLQRIVFVFLLLLSSESCRMFSSFGQSIYEYLIMYFVFFLQGWLARNRNYSIR